MYRHFSTAISHFLFLLGRMWVKRMSGNSRKCKAQRQYRSSVSRAIWPSNIQHCIATSKAAQRRRVIVIKGWWWISSWHKHITAKLLRGYTYIVTPVRQQLTTALITSGMMLAMYGLYQWWAWSPVVIICTLVCAILFLLLSEKQYTPTIPQTALPPQNEEFPQQITLFEFPETPVPSTPLIRVMETIDLSSSDVEHFIQTTADHRPLNNRRTVEQTTDHWSLNNRRTVEQPADQQKSHDV
jgi:hypothetical protein